jgi:hypothetical protein
MKNISLTVLTEPLPRPPKGLVPLMRSVLRPIKYRLLGKQRPIKKKYGGHYAVTRSLIEGLKKIDANFNYNPSGNNEIKENVIVLSGPQTLREAIELKKKGKIKFLLAGPNIADSVLDEEQIVADPAIDFFIVPSSWIEYNAVSDLDVLKNKILCWYVGVDVRYWAPEPHKPTKKVLVYWKTEEEAFCAKVEDILRKQNYTPVRITYGKYHPIEYKAALNESEFAVFISRSESQGVALAEAWAMNVPTLVWDPGYLVYRGRVFENANACPYLSTETGKKWLTLEELDHLLMTFDEYKDQFKPREHTINFFSDEVCSQTLLNFISSNT